MSRIEGSRTLADTRFVNVLTKASIDEETPPSMYSIRTAKTSGIDQNVGMELSNAWRVA
jgi:hypothetical protein